MKQTLVHNMQDLLGETALVGQNRYSIQKKICYFQHHFHILVHNSAVINPCTQSEKANKIIMELQLLLKQKASLLCIETFGASV
jgi:hypothetical protein